MKQRNFPVVQADLDSGLWIPLIIETPVTTFNLSSAIQETKLMYPWEMIIYNFTGIPIEFKFYKDVEEESLETQIPQMFDPILCPAGQIMENSHLPIVKKMMVRGAGGVSTADLRISMIRYEPRQFDGRY